MIRKQIGKITKKNVTLTEFEKSQAKNDPCIYIQMGIFGFFCTEEEFDDLYSIMNYYKNMEDILECKVKIEGEENESMAI